MSHLFKKIVAPRFLIFILAAGQLIGCSTSQPVDDKKVVKPTKSENQLLAEKMGMSVDTVQAFQAAIAELKKPKPDTKKAESLLLKVLKAEPNFAAAHYNLGVLYSNMSRYEDAVSHIEKARDIAPGELSHTVALAQAYAVTEQYQKAQDLLEQVIARQPNNLTAKNNLAVLAIKADKDKKAMEYVRDVLKENNQNVGALNSLGLIYAKRGNASLAKYVFNKAIKLSKENPDPDVHNNLGLVYMRQGNVPAAVEQFELANKADPNYLESRLNLGAILIEYLDYERAAKQFSQAVGIAPNHCVANLGLAAASYGLGKAEVAADGYKFYIDNCDAKHVSSYERLAKLYETKLKDPAQAADYYEKLLTLETDKKSRAKYKAMANFLRKQAESKSQKTPEQAPPAKEPAAKEDAPAKQGAPAKEDAPAKEPTAKEAPSGETSAK